MLDLLGDNWIALVSLFVALVGGVPGVIAAVNEWRARPNLAAYLHNIVVIKAADVWGETRAGFILFLAIGNKGKEPLVPLAYKLECQIGGKWLVFESMSLPEGYMVNGPDWQYKFVDVAENDIRTQGRTISRESPTHGFLAFVSRDTSLEELASVYMRMPIKLKCVDLFGKVHEFILNKDLKPTRAHASLPPGKGVLVTVAAKDSG
ncbi:MAG: hypothetical protein ACYCZS_04600 [Thiobacillus sp.]